MTKALVVSGEKSVVKTKFFCFSQNNSGGSFDEPAMYVIVEAMNAAQANQRAQEIGLYFDGCSTGRDCSCCGDRWYSQWDNSDGDDAPSIYGKALADMNEDDDSLSMRARWSREGRIPYAIISYLDGREEKLYVRK